MKIDKSLLEKISKVIIDYFEENEAKINDMNVFPVPDGDTGTNMLLTLKSIREEVLKIKDPTVKAVLENASMGALMGARGNSGVILSQILRGFLDVLMKNNGFNLEIIRQACRSSRDVAYGSVQNPTEGTMLTTIKDICSHVENICEENADIELRALLDSIIEEAEKSVERTTFLLPVLKEANVVDAGAQGILEILIGMRAAFSADESMNGKMNKKLKSGNGSSQGPSPEKEGGDVNMDKKKNVSSTSKELDEVRLKSDIKYTYCTELVVKGSGIKLPRLRENIESYGDSALVVGNENLVKIHVHTNTPQKVLKRAIKEGSLHDIQINNMKDQRMELVGEEAAVSQEGKAKRALMVVANGEGLEAVYKSLGVDVIVSGGQSMNPSTYDLVKAANNIDASQIIIFPNNKNIILTAGQAKKLLKKKTVTIVPTRTVTEGISAVLSYNPDAGIEENVSNMEQSIEMAKSGEVTRAVRDAKLHVGKIEKGAYLGLFNGDIKIVADDLIDAVIDLIRDMVEGHEEVITFYTGKDADKDTVEKLKQRVSKHFPDIDIEIHNGGQPLYPFIFSIE